MLNYPFRLTIEKCKVGQKVLIYDYELKCEVSVDILKVARKKVKVLIWEDTYRWFYPDDLKPKRIEVHNEDSVPKEIVEVYNLWHQRELEHEQTGYWKIGSKLEFEFKDEFYEMRPPIGGQCDRWEYCLDEIESKLIEIGCQNIYYNKGYLD